MDQSHKFLQVNRLNYVFKLTITIILVKIIEFHFLGEINCPDLIWKDKLRKSTDNLRTRLFSFGLRISENSSPKD